MLTPRSMRGLVLVVLAAVPMIFGGQALASGGFLPVSVELLGWDVAKPESSQSSR